MCVHNALDGMQVDTFMFDHERAVRQALSHLLEQNHRRIALFTLMDNWANHNECRDG